MHSPTQQNPLKQPILQPTRPDHLARWRPFKTAVLAALALLASLSAPLSRAEQVALLRASNLYLEPVSVSRLLGRVSAGANVETLSGRYGPWVQVRVSTGPIGWVQALDLNLNASSDRAPALPASAWRAAPLPAPGAPPTAVMDASKLSAQTPGMDQVERAQTYALPSEPARQFGFNGGLGLVKLPRAAKRTPANAMETAPIEPAAAMEKSMGQSFAAKQLAGRSLSGNVAVQHYVNLLGRWLSAESSRPDLDWTFAVVNDASFNAFSAPSGYVFITQGLLDRMENEAELAGILAHEIAMVANRYHLRGGLLRTPGANDQLEADVLAAELTTRTGLDSAGLRAVLQRMANVGFFSEEQFQPMLALAPMAKARLEHLQAVVGDRFDNLELNPPRRIPDRLNELNTVVASKSEAQ